MSVNVDQIVVYDKFKHSDEGFKYFIGYQEGEIVKSLIIVLPQVSGYMAKMVAKTCLSWLKMMKCEKNTKTFAMWLKIN